MTTWSKTAPFAALVLVTLAPSVQQLMTTEPPRAPEAPSVVRAESIAMPTVLPMPAAPVYSDAAKDPAAISDAFAAVAAAKPEPPAPRAAGDSPRLLETTLAVAALTPSSAAAAPDDDDGKETPKPTGSPSRAALEDLVRKEAAARGMPAEVAFAVVRVASGWDVTKTGDNGGIGLTQVVPRIARQFGYKGRDAALWEPALNVKWGMAYIAGAYKKAGGDLCRTAMKIAGGHYVETMTSAHRAYCDELKAAMAAPAVDGAAAVKTAN